jgi:hypothetical protein
MCCKSIDFIYDVAVAGYRRINKNRNTDVRQDLNIFNLRENKISAELLRTYCNVLVGSISQWNFIALKVQYTTVDYSQQLYNTRPNSTSSLTQLTTS